MAEEYQQFYFPEEELTVGKLIYVLQQLPSDMPIYADAEAAHDEDQFNSITIEMMPNREYVNLTVWYGW